MFKRMDTNGIRSLIGPAMKPENIKPNTAKARYLEIGIWEMRKPAAAVAEVKTSSDAKAATKPKVFLSWPELRVESSRIVPNGRVYLVSFHPALKMGMHVVEGEYGKDIFADFGSVLEDDVQKLPWFARVYEVTTAFTAMGE